MSGSTATDFRIIRKILSDKFDVLDIGNYDLILHIGVLDFQFCVFDTKSAEILCLEDVRFDGLRNTVELIKLLHKYFEDHAFLTAGFWNKVKLCLKSQKFSFVPLPHFQQEHASDYLVVNNEINPSMEKVVYYKHQKQDIVNVFAMNRKLGKWLKTTYPKTKLSVVHSCSSFVEGLNTFEITRKSFHCNIERGCIQIAVLQDNNLLICNQYIVKKPDDYLKYVMVVFKELEMDADLDTITLWGNPKTSSPHLMRLRKYYKHFNMGTRKNNLKFSYQFDECEDHQYFSTFSVSYCG